MATVDTTTPTRAVLIAVELERTRQVTKGYDAAHDDALTMRELVHRVYLQLPAMHEGHDAAPHTGADEKLEELLVRAAAVAVAAVESSKRRRGAQS